MDEIEQAALIVEIVDIQDFTPKDGPTHLLENGRIGPFEEIKKRRSARKQSHKDKRHQKQQQRIIFATDNVGNAALFFHKKS
jgi:hypothetical protein